MFKITIKAHPITIFGLMKPYLFILVLPMIRAVFQYLREGKTENFFLFEMIAVGFVSVIAKFGWKFIKITLCGDKIVLKKGVLIKLRAEICTMHISSILIEQGPIDRLVGSAKCHINTEAGSPQKSDFSLRIYKNDAEYLIKLLYGEEKAEKIRFSPFKIALLSAATSSAVTGIFVGVPIINQMSELVGVTVTEAFYNEISNISRSFKDSLPTVINIVTLILILAYIFSFGVIFIKNANFNLQSGKDKMVVRSGIFTLKQVVFKKSAINNVCFEQKPLLRIFKRYSLRVSVGGFGDEKGEKAVIVPILSQKEINKYRNICFFKTNATNGRLTPKSGLNRFLYLPTVILISTVTAAVITAPWLKRFDALILPAVMLVLLINIYYADICYYNYKNSELSFGGALCATGTSGLTIRKFYCDKNKIGVIKITKTPADRALGTCKAKFIVYSEKADNIRIKNFGYRDLMQALSENFDLKE